ncbi:RNA polymerase sigma factor [Sphingobacterium psychroaquaticum]|uniref:RNA polymerase sigma factor, sigma-70 family n=1 Tax=Sphingobacterium psychroaquaticum TaxID=561061 RepID=A0A1X7I076_9SPHI|nr:sigma-70 family RNA polymerase sigma factor [Sphingobacterium psychroaquaticum]SMG07764.1 RNA polymerase sigma factor, sigma-70 family [Sphingobacterium psychroaquaticum]
MSTIKQENLKDYWKVFVRSESEEAFYQVYQYYHHYLTFVGLKRGFPIEQVQDVVNDVFLYIWENKANNGHILNHHNYLVTMFLRALFRKQGMGENILFTDEELHEENAVSPSVEEGIIQRSIEDTVGELVKDKMDQLGEKQRLLIYQKFYLGLSYEEIARTNQISIHTVYNTIYKSVDKLRNLLSREQEAFLRVAIGALSVLLYSGF